MISGQFELNGYAFGTGLPWRVADFDTGARAVRSQDSPWPNRDGRLLGRDYDDGGQWAFLLRHRGTDLALDAVADLRSAWQSLRGPLETVALKYQTERGERRVYGRPRGFRQISTPHGREVGLADIEATFDLADPLHYSDAESSLTLGLSPASPRAWRFPMAPPFTWLSADAPVQVRQAVVGGDAPTPLRAIFRGPVADPWLQIGGVRVALVGSLAYDEVVTVDARLMTVRRQDRASVPGRLAPRVRMADLVLPPGTHEVSFGGVDATGTATATLEWRAAWRSL